MQIELSAQRRVDHVQLDRIDAERRVAQQPVRDMAQDAVGREIGRLRSHQQHVDNEPLAQKSRDHNDEQSQPSAQQMRPQRRDVLKKSHLVIG